MRRRVGDRNAFSCLDTSGGLEWPPPDQVGVVEWGTEGRCRRPLPPALAHLDLLQSPPSLSPTHMPRVRLFTINIYIYMFVKYLKNWGKLIFSFNFDLEKITINLMEKRVLNVHFL